MVPTALVLVAVLAGCTQQQMDGFMPGNQGGAEGPVTNHSDTIQTFWVNSWIVLLGVGLLVWSLIIWATIAYRRRKGEKGLPFQMRYHMPIEILFTTIPIVLVGAFFAFTAREQAVIEEAYAAEEVDVHVEVYGKQWAWDFNYLNVPNSQYDSGVYTVGIQAQQVGDDIDYDQLPKLYLPVDANVKIDLKSRDVAHSFWVVDFLYKKDTIPGQTNSMSIHTEREGVYIGKCAELCGEYHAMMLFEVHVVSQEEYNAYIASVRESGQVIKPGEEAPGDQYNRNPKLLTTTPAPSSDEEGQSQSNSEN